MQKSDFLIRTKLRQPFTRQELVPRPRLHEQVALGLSRPLTLIAAPAGFGKTTLAAAAIAGCKMPVAWLSLDQNDSQIGRFLSYLLAALAIAVPAIGGETARLAALAGMPPEAVLTNLINELDGIGSEIALVLDDYHAIHSQAVHEAVTFLLEHCPTTFHLVIISRSDPPLPLARLRARGQLLELRAADLRFNEPEAAQFLNQVMGLRLDPQSIAVLEERTEGWIAGLQMAALSMRDGKDTAGFIEGFSGANRYILDYLLEEVLDSQPPEIQRFLLRTSVLERLTAPLCDAVLDVEGSASATTLERLERANLFLMLLDDERKWYRYHRLFADLLRARLNQANPALSGPLQSRAAAWCEQNGLAAEAVSYALAAKDYPRAGELVAKYWGDFAAEGQIETLWSWLAALPEDAIRSSAALGVACCWVLWLNGRIDAIEPHLMDAERALGQTALTGEPDLMLPTMIAVLHSIVARHHNDFASASAYAESALAQLPQNLPPDLGVNLRTLIFLALASAYDGAGDLERAAAAYAEVYRLSRIVKSATGVGITYRLIGVLRLLGRLKEAETVCREALQFFAEQGIAGLPAAGILHLSMAEVLMEKNELEAAQDHLRRGKELGKHSGRFDAVRNAAPFVHLRLALGDADGALAAVEEAEAALGEARPPLAEAELLALKARVLIQKGALPQAGQCAQEAVRLAGPDQGQTGQTVALAAARAHAALVRPQEAVALLNRSLSTAEERGLPGEAIELLILRGLTLQRQGEIRQAQADLERALVMAEPRGFIRVFLNEGQPLRTLLEQWAAHAAPGSVRDYALRLLSQFEVPPQSTAISEESAAPNDNLIEPLSQRELEVLQQMAQGLTNQQIAKSLVVAPGTIKAHAASIYRKLDVANRTEAAARARELGILP